MKWLRFTAFVTSTICMVVSYTNLVKVIYRGSDLEQSLSVARDLQ